MQNWEQEDSHMLTQEQKVTGVRMCVWCLCPQDVDEFFQTEREHNHLLTGCSKTAAEVNPETVFSFVRDVFRNIKPTTSLLFPAEIPGCGAN